MWMSAHGVKPPEEQRRRSGRWYVSVMVERQSDYLGDPRFFLTFPTPSNPLGALLSPIDDHHWYLSVNGRDGEEPPSTAEQVLTHLERLDEQGIHEAVKGTSGFGELHRFHRVVARWRRYDRLVRPLAGLLPMGDAVSALDPLFGQGMSLASWQAVLLRDHLLEVRDVTSNWRVDFTERFHREVAMVVGAAWGLDEDMDRHFMDESGGFSMARIRAFADLLATDPVLHRQYVSMWHLLEPASLLDDEGLTRRWDERVQANGDL